MRLQARHDRREALALEDALQSNLELSRDLQEKPRLDLGATGLLGEDGDHVLPVNPALGQACPAG